MFKTSKTGIYLVCALAALLISFVTFLGLKGWASVPRPYAGQLDNIAASSSTSEVFEQAKSNHTPVDGWKPYENSRFHYRLLYPPSAQMGSDIGGIAPSESEVIYLSLDPQGDPTFICAADNVSGWSPKDVLDQWVKTPPVLPYAGQSKYEYGKCMARDQGPPPPNVLSTASSITISGLSAYEVTNVVAKRYEAVCDYFATEKTVVAACLPPQDMTDPRWTQNLALYREVLSTLKIPG